MEPLWFLLLVVGLPIGVSRLLRPRRAAAVPDFLQMPLVLRAAGGIRQHPAFLLLGAIVNAPVLLLLVPGAGTRAEAGALFLAWSGLALPLLLQGAVAQGALRPLRRGQTSARGVVGGGLVGLGRSVKVCSIVMAACAASLLLLPLVRVLPGPPQGPGPASVGCGVAVLVAVFYSAFSLGPSIAMDRRVGAPRALVESMELTFSYRVRITGILWLFAFLQVALGMLAYLGADPRAAKPAAALAMYAITSVIGTWHALTMVIVFHRLRKLRYGGEVDGLVEVFE